jgi:trans-aconitate methyltransferase
MGPMANNAWDAAQYDSSFGFVTRHGDALVDVLAPQPGEWVLDLGCGTGHHAAHIAARGATVVGMDLDDSMLAKARQDHPGVRFVRADGTDFGLEDLGVDVPFHACLSNAALHWMTPQEAVLRNVRAVLVAGGRFVAEMGGDGNIAALDAALRRALAEHGLTGIEVPRNHFPTVGQQTTALEAAGFRVEEASWFRRPTPLEPGSTPADWTQHFRAAAWDQVPQPQQAAVAARVDDLAHTAGLWDSGRWVADYCRLRFVAVAR